jgi:hypothetical protein
MVTIVLDALVARSQERLAGLQENQQDCVKYLQKKYFLEIDRSVFHHPSP